MSKTKAVILAITLALALTSCGSASDSASQQDDRPLIATTVSPITSIAASIAGDRARIEGIVPEGTNSHTFEPSPRIAELLSNADLILINGLKLEDPTLEMARLNKKEKTQIVELGTLVLPEVDYIYDFSFPKSGGKPNPHLWTDPGYAIKYAEVIKNKLSEIDSRNAAYYAENYAVFKKHASELGAAVAKDQQSVPAGNLKMLTYHDAYAYFAKSYGWTVVGALQAGDFGDPAPSEIVRLIEQIKREKVKTIFGSEVFPSDVLKEIGRASGARYESSLRDDDLPGVPGDSEHSWFGLMRYNYRTMVLGLGGKPIQIDALDNAPVISNSAKFPQ